MLNRSAGRHFPKSLFSTLFACFCSQASADHPWWTAVGSAGVVDDEDFPYVALGGTTPSGFGLFGNEGTARITSNSPTPTVAEIRFNVTNPPPEGDCTIMRVRFRDNGNQARVLVQLREYSFNNSGFLESAPVRMSFDSNQPNILPDSDFQEYTVYKRGSNVDISGTPILSKAVLSNPAPAARRLSASFNSTVAQGPGVGKAAANPS